MTASTAPSEPRGIAAAMSQPVFSTRAQERSLSAADRAARRWAPEAAEDQPRSVRSLSFVDRTVAPWISTAQRSAGLRMFSQYASGEVGERAVGGVSWVFPRPWYQDELDWIAASRAGATGRSTIFTTRGTYAAAGAQPAPSMSSMSAPPMIEYVAPSFASGDGSSSAAAFSPLVAQSTFSAASIVAQSMRAIQTASAMARGLAPATAMVMPAEASSSTARTLAGFSALAPLVSQLIPAGEASVASWAIAQRAPELVTPPSPRGEEDIVRGREPASLDAHAAQQERSRAVEQSRAMAQVFAQERERLVAQERQAAQQAEQKRQLEAPAASAPSLSSRAEAERVEVLRESLRLEIARTEAARVDRARVQSTARQQARIDALVAERMAQLDVAGAEPVTPAASVAAPAMGQETLVSALRFAELMAHTASVGPSAMAPSAGPRVALPTGLGGLVAAVNTVSAIERERTMPTASWSPRAVASIGEQAEGQPVVAPGPSTWSALQTPRPFLAAASFAPAFAPAFTPALAASLEPQAAPSQVQATSARLAASEGSALGAVAAQRPHALAHIAWSDRWLGRFAGASDTALEAMSTVALRARLAPEQLFLAPALTAVASGAVSPAAERGDIVRSSLPVVAGAAAPRAAVEASPVVAPAPAARPEPTRRPEPAAEVLRFADDDVVPDEMLAAIMAPRPSARPTSAPQVAAPVAASQAVTARAPRVSAADVAALTAPAAPVDAGLSPALAASPMAPALQHVLPMPRAAVFDARALAGAELATAFLTGAMTAPILSHTLQPLVGLGSALGGTAIAAPVPANDEAVAPSSPWRQWAAQWTSELVQPIEAPATAARLGHTRAAGAPAIGAPATDSTAAASAAAVAAASSPDQGIVTLRSTLLAPASPRQQLLAATFGTAASWLTHEATDAMPTAYQTLGELLAEVRAAGGSAELPLATLAGERAIASSTLLAAGAGPVADDVGAPAAALARGFELPMVLLPSLVGASPALGAGLSSMLAASASLPASVAGGAAGAVPAPLAAVRGGASSAAWPREELAAPLLEQSLLGSMDRNTHSPGMTAQRALGFGATQSTQAADLSFDFVPPELVLAARVYGFGPAEAAQAVRLAMAGPTGLSSMASAVDLRFVALAATAGSAPDAQRAAALGSRGPDATLSLPALSSGQAGQAGGPSGYAASPAFLASQAPVAAGEAFGVERRMPRGAFLLPSASVAGMGLSAAMPDGEHGMPVAALEILAAKLVAELGTFAGPALAELGLESTRAAGGRAANVAMPVAAGPAAAGSTGVAGTGFPVGFGPGATGGAEEASEAVVLSSAAATVGAARRARFDALYVALSESPGGRTMSPAARAARALALANRDEESPALSSRERAALAWQIYPVVLGGEVTGTAGAAGTDAAEPSGRAARARGSFELPALVGTEMRPGAEMRPGLGALSARAGEALTSFVTSSPIEAPRPQASSDSSRSPSWRSGRFGGGEVEIPTWFEAAARKMFEEQRDVEGISLADLTLIASPPPQQLAASSRDTPAAAPSMPAASESKGDKGQKVDIEKVAREVYKAFMDICRSTNERNGNPYL